LVAKKGTPKCTAAQVKLEVVVKNSDSDAIIDAIVTSAQTGRIGDGKIFVSNVDEVIRIRTQEAGEDAL
jgi:nitrogen regulatory protein P-II 1